jgi:hypothetical protein
LTHAPRPPAAPDVTTVARALGIDALTIEVLRAFRAAGCRSIVLKGPAFRRHLYDDGEPRGYGDVDLLVAPADLPRAGAVLAGLGYELVLDHEEHPGMAEPHAQEWARPGGARVVDLHWRLWGLEAPPERAWEVLSARTEPMRVGTEQAEVLPVEGIALMAALHAAFHGRGRTRSALDLERAVERFGHDTWGAAARLATELDGADAFAAGLSVVAAGERLAATLGLAAVRSPERVLLAGDQPEGSVGLLRLMEPAPAGARLRALRYALAPSAAYMRATSPLATRGRAGLALAYLARAGRRTAQLPAAIRAVRRARAGGRGQGLD